MEKTNVLLIMADQLTGMVMPMNGHGIVKTPHLQGLAQDGVNFTHAYCNNPICAPSRASMLTGLLASRVGAYDNGAAFPSEVPTIGHYLASKGYSTCLSGKMHFVGADQNHGYTERLTTDIYPSDYGWTADWEAPGPYPYAPSRMTVRGVIEAGVCVSSMQTDHDEEVAHTTVRKIHDLARDTTDTPFFLTASFTNPHNPFTVPQEFFDLYSPEEIDMPLVPGLPPEERDAWSKRYYYLIRQDEHHISDEHIRRARHSYYAMTSYVDHCVGRIIKALKDTGQYDSTLIVFTADHGDMLGERGMWYKFNPYEWSMRIPMIIKAPGAKPGRKVHVPVSLLDLAPTILDYAGSRESYGYTENFEGSSLVPLLNGKDDWDNRPVCMEFTAEGVHAPGCIIRDHRYKYIHCGTDPELLFDMHDDPSELNNLAADAGHAHILAAMRKILHETWDLAQMQKDILRSQQRRLFLQNNVLSKAPYPDWDYQVRVDAARQYVRTRNDPSTALTKSRARFPYVPLTPEDFPRKQETAHDEHHKDTAKIVLKEVETLLPKG